MVAESKRPAVTIPYRANLLGNIEQALKGLQGYGIMALELIQNADDAGSKRLFFDARDDALVVGNDGEFSRGAFGAEPEGDGARSDHAERENTRARGRSDGQGRGGSSPFRNDGGRQR